MRKRKMRRIDEMKWTEAEKKQLKIFMLTAFGLPVLMGILMGYGYFRGADVTTFANAHMFYPAAGVMLALLLTEDKEKKQPRKFYIAFLVSAALMIAAAVASVLAPGAYWLVIIQLLIIASSIICLIVLLFEKKEVRAAYGLKINGSMGVKSWLYVFLFIVLYFFRSFVGCVIEGQTGEFAAIFKDPATWVMILVLLVTIVLSFTAFFGEEYGWRYFFQPLLQKRFGLKGGVLILGVLWGLWHLPLNIFYYSPDTWMISVLLQLITCVSYSIFFGYCQMRTGNIWVAVTMHYINNNMIAVLSGTTDIGGQVYKWTDVPVMLALNLMFIVFIFAKAYRMPLTSPEEVSDNQ